MRELGVLIVSMCMALAAGAAELNLMPRPSHVAQQQGFLAIDHTPRIEVTGGDERVQRATERFLRNLSAQTGVPFDRHFAGTPEGPTLAIHSPGSGLRV